MTHFVALGANLVSRDGLSPRQTLEAALVSLAAIPGLRLQARSRWFATAPIPPGPPHAPYPRYINGVARLAGNIAPDDLLHALHAIEHKAGRARSIPNAPRTLDLDIIAMGSRVQSAPDPILPHPRAHLRAFVLLPLRDVAPHWIHPLTQQPIAQLIAALPQQDITSC